MPVTVAPDPDASPPRNRVTVSRGTTTRVLPVVRVAADGSTVPLRADVRLSSGVGIVDDVEAPYGVPVAYRVIDGTTTETSPQVVLDAGHPWLVHPYTASLSVRVTGAAHGEPLTAFAGAAFRTTTRATGASTVTVLNRDDPITQRVGRRRARASTMVLRTRTLPQYRAMEALVEDDSPLLLQVPAAGELRWGVRTAWVQLEDVEDERQSHAGDHSRLWTMPYRVAGRPVGTAAAGWTWADLAATYATWADVEAAYATWLDVEADIRRVAS